MLTLLLRLLLVQFLHGCRLFSLHLPFKQRYQSSFRPILFTETPWHPLLACALYIVPGVPLINAVNDLLDNHINTGLVRAMNTLLIVIAMSFGIMLAIKCWLF